MSIKKKLMDEFKTAMKEKDAIKKNTITLVRSAIKQIEVDKRIELTDEQIIDIIAKQVKQKNNAIEEFDKGNRQDLVDDTKKEIEILMPYLPVQLSNDDVKKLVLETIEETGASSPQDMRKVMPVIMAKTKGKADGKLVSQLVKECLNK